MIISSIGQPLTESLEFPWLTETSSTYRRIKRRYRSKFSEDLASRHAYYVWRLSEDTQFLNMINDNLSDYRDIERYLIKKYQVDPVYVEYLLNDCKSSIYYYSRKSRRDKK